jgi:hypothetical protein
MESLTGDKESLIRDSLASVGSTVVEYSSHHPKFEGLSPAPAAGTGRENGQNARTGIFLFNEMSFQNQTWGAGERGTGVRLVRPITAVILVSTF